jgi:hypothetical protein
MTEKIVFVNPDAVEAVTEPSVEVPTLGAIPGLVTLHESVHSVNTKTGNVVLDASDILYNTISIAQTFDNIGAKTIVGVDIIQNTSQPAQLQVTTHYLDGTPAATSLTNFISSGHLHIGYDAVYKTLLFQETATKLHLYPIPATVTQIPEAGSNFIWTISVIPDDTIVGDLILFYDSGSNPVFFGHISQINPTEIQVKVIASSYKYVAVKTYTTKNDFPPIVNAESRFFYIAADTGLIYSFINNEYKLLNDGGVLQFPDRTSFPAAGDFKFLYMDTLHHDLYGWLVDTYVLLNDGGVIDTNSGNPRPIIGNPRFLYIDTDTGHIYAWIVNKYVMLNEGGVIAVATYSDLPATPDYKFLYSVADTGDLYGWLKGAWVLLNDGGVRNVNSMNPLPAVGDLRFVYANTDTGLVYIWVGSQYRLLNDGGILQYATIGSFPATGNWRYLYVATDTWDIYAWLGTQYVLLNEGGIRKVPSYASLPVNPNDRFLYTTLDTGDMYAWIGGTWVLLNDGGIIYVQLYADLPSNPNTRFLYVVRQSSKAYIYINNRWVELNREGGLYEGTWDSATALPTDRGDVGDWALVKHNTSNKPALWTITNVDSTGVRTWAENAILADIIGPKFLGYFYTESAITAAIGNNPGLYNIGDFAILVDNGQLNPAVPVENEPPVAASRTWIYIIKSIQPQITYDNQIYLDSRGAYKGVFPTPTDLPQDIQFDNKGAKKGDWAIVQNNGINRSALYIIVDYNTLVPSVSWTPSFVFPQIDIQDDLLGQGVTDKALSANQGYVLDQKVTALESDMHMRGTVLNAFVSQAEQYVIDSIGIDITGYYIQNVVTPLALNAAGTGYAVGDKLTIETTGPLPIVITVTAVDDVSTGVITDFTWKNGYSLSTVTQAGTPTVGGTGTGATFDIAMTDSSNATGWGYQPGDALILSNADASLDAIVVVGTVDSKGGIATLALSKGGSFTTTPANFVDPGGSLAGYGVILAPVSSIEPNTVLANIISPKANDIAIVLKDEIHANTAWQWIYADYNGDGIYNWVPLAPHNTQRDFIVDPIQEMELAPGIITARELAPGVITERELSSTVPQEWTFVVRTNQDMDAWCDNLPGNNYSRVLIAPSDLSNTVRASPGKYVNTLYSKTTSIQGVVVNGNNSIGNYWPIIYFNNTISCIYDQSNIILECSFIRVIHEITQEVVDTPQVAVAVFRGTTVGTQCAIHNCIFESRILANVVWVKSTSTSSDLTIVGVFSVNSVNIRDTTVIALQIYDSSNPTHNDNNMFFFVGWYACNNIINCRYTVKNNQSDAVPSRTSGSLICFLACNYVHKCVATVSLQNSPFVNGNTWQQFSSIVGFNDSAYIYDCSISIDIQKIRYSMGSGTTKSIIGFHNTRHIFNSRSNLTIWSRDATVPGSSIQAIGFFCTANFTEGYFVTGCVSSFPASTTVDRTILWFGYANIRRCVNNQVFNLLSTAPESRKYSGCYASYDTTVPVAEAGSAATLNF